MSKSRGNDVDPAEMADRLGAEIVRLWVASVDFREDVVGSEALMKRMAENYRKLRNTFRFVLGNLYDFDPQRDSVSFEKLEALDQYLLGQTAAMSEEVIRWYGEFAFHKIYQRVNHFCVVELSAFYFDVLKDRLYISAPFAPGRRAAQTAIWRIAEALVRLLAPVMSFSCEEVWRYLPRVAARLESVHLAAFPVGSDIRGQQAAEQDEQLGKDWSALRSVREEVLKALEQARNATLIGSGLEAQVAVAAPDPLYSALVRYQHQLRYLFIVSAVRLDQAASGNGTGGVTVKVSRAEGRKCERCWNYSVQVGADAAYPSVCERCSAVLKQIAAHDPPGPA
jgi:isoleucyl-tRNA synthetase